LLPFPTGTLATGISDDGTVILLTTQAPDRPLEPVYRWTEKGVTVIEALGQSDLIVGEALSGDGNTIVGHAVFVEVGFGAFRWTASAGVVYLGDLEGGAARSFATAVSYDGSCAVGRSSSASSGSNLNEAFRWTDETGMVGLGVLDGDRFASSAWGVSGDGTVVVGSSTAGDITEPFIWDSAGMRPLRELLDIAGLGEEIVGWQLVRAKAVSADGRTIVGNGRNPDGQDEPWIAFLGDPHCLADWDRDGSVNSSDFFAFLEDFFCEGKGCDSADFNADGVENSQDFFDFIVAFFTGC
jgi:probable HAF family extracellular repeat protein